MKKCIYCGFENSDDSKFCVGCGTQLPEAAAVPVSEPVAKPVAQPEYQAPQPQVIEQPSYQETPQYKTITPEDYYTPQVTATAPRQTTNGLCVAGFVISLVSLICLGASAIVSLILSIVGLTMANKKNQKGKGLAIAGITISTILIVFFCILVVIYGMAAKIESDRLSDPDDSEYSDMNIKSLIKGEEWVETESDSYLVFKNSRTFYYYRDYQDTDDNYYTGSYELYVGEDAFEYVTDDLEEYGITEDEIDDLIDRNDEYTMDNLICIVLNNESCIQDGDETMDHTVVTPYVGFYLVEDGHVVLDLTNMNAAEYYWFVPLSEYDD